MALTQNTGPIQPGSGTWPGRAWVAACLLGWLATASVRAASIESIEIWQGIDYESPGGRTDTTYDFRFTARTDNTVTGIDVLTAANQTFQIAPGRRDLPPGVQTWVHMDGNALVWGYAAQSSASDFLSTTFGDGDYVVTFTFTDRGQLQTTVPFSVPGTGAPIAGPTGQPELGYPPGDGRLVDPNITFTWVAPGASQATGVRLIVERTDTWTTVIEHRAGPDDTSYGPVTLDPWTGYEWSIAIERSYLGITGQGIPFEVGKYSEGDHLFGTTGPRHSISGTVSYPGRQTGNVLVQAFRDDAFSGSPAGAATIAAPGAYTIAALPAGFTYFVRAFRDTDGNGLPASTEAFGVYAIGRGPAPVLLDADKTGIDIVLTDPDSDGDGLPDYWELKHGLDPAKSDSNNNGVPDGAENPDGDRLDNLRESQLGTDPAKRDNVVVWFDAAHDADGDGLTQNLTGMAAAVAAAGYTLVERNVTITADEFAGIDVLFLYDAQTPYTPAEVAAIQAFLDDGGRLLVFDRGVNAADAGASLRSLLNPHGIDLGTAVVNGNLDTIVQPHPIGEGLQAPLKTGGGFVALTGGAALAANGVSIGAVAAVTTTHARIVAVGTDGMIEDGVFSGNEEDFLLNALDWLVTPWRFSVTVTNAQVTTLTFGMRVGAEPGPDDYDALTAPASPLEAFVALDSTGSNLRADYRPEADTAAWDLLVDARTATADCALAWDTTRVPDGGLFLYEVDVNGDALAGGTRLTLDRTAELTVAIGALRYFRIAFGVNTFQLTLRPGWNLIGVPITPDVTAGELFRGIPFYGMWGYDEISHRLHRIAAGDRLLGKKGYWIYSPGNLTTDPAMGTPVGTPTVLVQGWNLVSPAAACNPPGVGSVAAAWYWDAEDTRYRMVAHDEQLQPGVGYWLNARQAGVVDLD